MNNFDRDSQLESHKQLQNLISNLSDVLDAAIANASEIETEGLEKLLGLISTIVSGCQNSFNKQLEILIELKYVSENTDLEQIEKNIDLYRYNFSRRRHEIYCSKLRELLKNHQSLLTPELLKANIEDLENLLELLFYFSGVRSSYIRIERTAYQDIYSLLSILNNSKTQENYKLVKNKSANYIKLLNNQLSKLQSLNNQILGLSGRAGFLELVDIPERLQEVSVTMIDKNTNYDLKGSKFGGGFAAEGGIQSGGTFIDISSSNNLTEAAQQIQELLQQLQTQGMNAEEAQKQAAQDLAKKAEQDPTLMGKLIQWSKSIGSTVGKTTISEATKRVFKLALQIAGVSLP